MNVTRVSTREDTRKTEQLTHQSAKIEKVKFATKNQTTAQESKIQVTFTQYLQASTLRSSK